jgi:hypothetical protein
MTRFFAAAVFAGLVALGLTAPAAAEPSAECRSASSVPPEIRLKLWSEFLQKNPDTPYRAEILAEIDAAAAELWGGCAPSLNDGTIDPFAAPKAGRERELVDPFDAKPKGPPKGPSGPKAPPAGAGPVDPFARPPSEPRAPDVFGDGTIDPFSHPKAAPNGELINPFARPKRPARDFEYEPLYDPDGTIDPFQ